MAANPVASEPVLTGAIAAVLTFLAARYGLDLSAEQAAGAAGLLITVLAPFVRQLVRPTVKDEPVTLTAVEEHTMPPATGGWATPWPRHLK